MATPQPLERAAPRPRHGALLLNLGTPRSPAVADVRSYLREFLSDPYVLDMPAPARWLLLHGVILPFRPRRSAHAYSQVWTAEGSPLRVYSEALRSAVAEELGEDWSVQIAMRYGEPGIRAGLAGLAGAERIRVLPLYPQYSTAATGSSLAAVREAAAELPAAPPLDIAGAFYDDPGFQTAWRAVAAPRLADFRPDFTLLSYHGLPERQVRRVDPGGDHCLAAPDCCESLGARNRDCYRAQCFATSRALASALGLAPEAHATAFQSRLGLEAWIRPHTDRLLPELFARGVRRLAVLCPSFVADCLETLEEIGIRGRAQWREVGGEDLLLVPSLNAEPTWVRAVAGLLRGSS